MMANLDGQRLPEWIETTVAATMAPLEAFARNLRKDFDAVTAGLTLPWSSGRVEGQVNRVILWNLICQVWWVLVLNGTTG